MANNFLLEKIRSLKVTKSRPQSKQKAHAVSSDEVVIEEDPLTNKPSLAWERLSRFHPSHPLSPDTYLLRPRQDNILRFVCLSDTHGAAEQKRQEFHKRIPDGDVLIHCGDFTMVGNPSEITTFDSFMGKLPHPVKLVIAGNHELTLEQGGFGVHPELVRQQLGLERCVPPQQVVAACRALLHSVLYLEDDSITLCGINIYGTPWVPRSGSWGFSVSRGYNLLQKWKQIPSDTDILITHGPPLGYGDEVGEGSRAGCVELLNTVVKRVRPKFHVFGHIHTGHGMWTNGTTTFINAATCSNKYKPDHDPIVFDYPLPKGYSREDFLRLSTESLRQTRAKAAEEQTEQNGGMCGHDDSAAEGELVQSQPTVSKQTDGVSGKTKTDVVEGSSADKKLVERNSSAEDDCGVQMNGNVS